MSDETQEIYVPKGWSGLAVSPAGRVILSIPEMDDGEDVPKHVLAITEIFFRLERDPEWLVEMADAFVERKDD